MKFFLISDNHDSALGMRLCGIDSVIVFEKEDVERELEKVMKNKDYGIVLITANLMDIARDAIYQAKQNNKTPLIVEVADRHGNSHMSDSISRYIKESVGIVI